MIDRWDTRPYLQRLGDAISQLANVAFSNGMPDESLSGRAWRNTELRARAGLPVADRWLLVRDAAELLFWPIDRGEHCRLAFEQDIRRSALRAESITAVTPINDKATRWT